MSVEEIKNLLDSNPNYIYFIPVIFLGFCLIFWLIARLLQKNKETNKIKKIIKEIGAKYIQNASLPDGVDGFIFIDFLLLTPTGILVVDVLNLNGFLFGGDAVDEWTQMIGHKSYKFNNPLPINQQHILAVSAQVGDVPVYGRVVFTSLGNFPKGIPDGVSPANNFQKDVNISVTETVIPELYLKAWNDLHIVIKESKKKLASKNK